MPQALRRSGPERRYPILMALLAEAHIDRGDELLSPVRTGARSRVADREPQVRGSAQGHRSRQGRARESRRAAVPDRAGLPTVQASRPSRSPRSSATLGLIGSRPRSSATRSSKRRRRRSATTSCTSRSPGFRRPPGASSARCRCACATRTAAGSAGACPLSPGSIHDRGRAARGDRPAVPRLGTRRSRASDPRPLRAVADVRPSRTRSAPGPCGARAAPGTPTRPRC
jgi:hypothetical protein